MKRTLLFAVCVLSLNLCGCSRSGKLVVGMDATYPPFEMLDEKGNFSGVGADMGRALGAYLGKEVEFRNINFDGLITALKSGSVDCVISSMTANDERRKSIDFSDPYVKNGIALLVSAKSTVKSAEDLKTPGRKIVVRLGTTGESYAREYLKDAQIVALDSDPACVLEVTKGGVDAWIYDQISVMLFHLQQPDATRAILKPLREEVWAIGLKQGDDEFKKKVNAFLAKYRADGGFKAMADKYLVTERKMMAAEGIPFVFDL